MKKTLLSLGLAAILLTGCDGPTKNLTAPNLTITQISADTRHTMSLNGEGDLYANGWNEVGAMGNGIKIEDTISIATKVLSAVESVDTGYNFTMIVKKDGTLWATGENGLGQLGLGNTNDVTSFTQAIDSNGNPMTGVSSVSTGRNYTLALKKDGTLWATGQNFQGQLGLGDNLDKNVFTQVTGLGTTVSKIATGDFHSLILLSNGDILTAGDNWFGALGNGNGGAGTGTNVYTKVTDTATIGTVLRMEGNQVGSFIVNTDGDLYVSGDNWATNDFPQGDPNLKYGAGGLGTSSSHTFTKVNGITGVVGIDAKYTSVALATSEGKLLVSGNNSHGQMGTGTNDDFVSQFIEVSSGVSAGENKISTGNYTGFYVNKSGKVYASGDNWFGNIGNAKFGAGTGYTAFTSVTE